MPGVGVAIVKKGRSIHFYGDATEEVATMLGLVLQMAIGACVKTS